MFLSYQDFEAVRESEKAKSDFIKELISYHKGTEEYKIACDADQYEIQENITIKQFVRIYYTLLGEKRPDYTVANNRLASNYFHRLNTQRNNYLLGNGVKLREEKNKEKLGKDFDSKFKEAAYNALIHGKSYIYWNVGQIHNFKLTEFAPLIDENTGELRAGVRFWQIDPEKPVIAVLYEEDGFTKYKADSLKDDFVVINEKRPYKIIERPQRVGETPDVIGEENYGVLPIVPIYGDKTKRSKLPRMRWFIDAYDMGLSGFANDMDDVAQIYWLIQNADGMSQNDLNKFFDRMKLNHIVKVGEGQSVEPHTQEIPYNARESFLNMIRKQLYEDYGGLDVHVIAAGATNDHIDAAYQPMDEECDEFEYCVDEAMARILELAGLDEEAKYKRNRISNEKERTDMINSTADHLDEQTYLSKLPFLEPDEVQIVMDRRAEEDIKRFNNDEEEDEEE